LGKCSSILPKIISQFYELLILMNPKLINFLKK